MKRRVDNPNIKAINEVMEVSESGVFITNINAIKDNKGYDIVATIQLIDKFEEGEKTAKNNGWVPAEK